MSIDVMIQKQRKKVAEIDCQISDLKEKINELASLRASEQGKVEGLLMAQESSIGPSQNPKVETRRMRLGGKKRVIYSLVLNGFETVGSIISVLNQTDIDSKYIKNVVRKAISSNDMVGQIDDRFLLSEDGKEILAKASKPNDWTVLYESLCQKMPHPIPPNGNHAEERLRANIIAHRDAVRNFNDGVIVRRRAKPVFMVKPDGE